MTTLGELAKRLSINLKGDSSKEIHYIKDIERVKHPSDILENAIYFVENKSVKNRNPYLNSDTAVLTKEAIASDFKNALFIKDESKNDTIKLAFIKLLGFFSVAPHNQRGSISEKAYIDPSAHIHPSVCIMPHAVIMENTHVEEGAVIYPNVTLEAGSKVGQYSCLHPSVVLGYNCKIGKNCIIYGGTVIGADGFGYYDHNKERYKVPQISHVEIGDYVEIGSNCSIDRGTIEPTTIGNHTKIDNQIQIGHNCQVGEYVYIAGNTGISGSVTIKKRAIIAGQVGIADHVTIGEESVIMALTGVHDNTKPKTTYFGIPARPFRESFKISGALPHLPDLLKRVKSLENDSK